MGEVDWVEPTERIHHAVNVGKEVFEEVVTFFLDRSDAVPQPAEDSKWQLVGLDRPDSKFAWAALKEFNHLAYRAAKAERKAADSTKDSLPADDAGTGMHPGGRRARR